MSEDLYPYVELVQRTATVPVLELELTAHHIAANLSAFNTLCERYEDRVDTSEKSTFLFRVDDLPVNGLIEIVPGMVVRVVNADPLRADKLHPLPSSIAEAIRARAPVRRYRAISLAELLERPDPPDASICKKLGIALGDRPMGIIGYSGTGKSWIMAWLALQLVTGRPLFGNHEWQSERRCRVLHLDYEMNWVVSKRRYADLCQTMGIDYALDVANDLHYGEHPDFYLNDPNAEDTIRRETKGFDVVMIDAFRGTIPGEDENDSKIRLFVDTCTRISASECRLFVFLLHTGHAGKNQASEARGSTAIRDGSGTMFVVHGELMAPKQVTNNKLGLYAGKLADPFYVKQERVGDPENGPMRLEYMTKEQGDEKQNKTDRLAWVKVQKKILNEVRLSPCITRNKLFGATHCNRTTFDKVLAWLLANDFVDNKGTDQRHKYVLAKLGQEWLDKGTQLSRPDAPPDSRPVLLPTETNASP